MQTMRSRNGAGITRIAIIGSLALAVAPHAAAQDASAEVRVRRLEGEVRALQRKVFPSGGGQAFEPEITPPAAAAPPTGAPASTTAMTDLLTRMDALDAQMARITAQNEQNTNAIAQIEARLGPANPGVTAPASANPAVAGPPDTASSDAAPSTATSPPPPSSKPTANPASPTPGADRLAAVRAVAKPQSGDAGADEYSYGYRLYAAKFYPEAEQQLRLYLQKYPKHPRVSFARNLLGRAYLDDGDAREAAKWFLQNYQADKAGARAPDSLLYLARAMKQIGDAKRACVALGEFGSSYSAEAAGRLKGDYDDTRKGLTCG